MKFRHCPQEIEALACLEVDDVLILADTYNTFEFVDPLAVAYNTVPISIHTPALRLMDAMFVYVALVNEIVLDVAHCMYPIDPAPGKDGVYVVGSTTPVDVTFTLDDVNEPDIDTLPLQSTYITGKPP